MKLSTVYLDKPLQLKRAIDVAKPIGEAKATVLFYVHGGGWSAGSRDAFHHHMEHFSSRGYWCASAGYRLAPTAKWNEQLTDIMEGYDRFLRLLEEQQVTVSRVIVIGSSAGAHLASLLALMQPDEVNASIRLGDWRTPDACVSINGPGTLAEWADMNESIRESIEKVIGVKYEENSDAFLEASPDHYVREGCPNFLFFNVENEKYFPHDLVHRLSDKIREAGSKSEVIFCKGADHGFFYGISNPLQLKALGQLEAYIIQQND
jgi:acetyl esterase/lipase